MMSASSRRSFGRAVALADQGLVHLAGPPVGRQRPPVGAGRLQRQSGMLVGVAQHSPGLDRRRRVRRQRLGQRPRLLVRRQRPGVVGKLEGLPPQRIECSCQVDTCRRARASGRCEFAADRHRLPVRLQRLRLLADLVDQLPQLRVRLGQHRLRGVVGLAPQQLAQPVVKPPRRAQQLVPQRPQPVLLQRLFLLDALLQRADRVAGQVEPRLHPDVRLGQRRVSPVLIADGIEQPDVGPVELDVLVVEPPVGGVLHGDRRRRPADDRQRHRRGQRRDRRPPPTPQPRPLGRSDPPRRNRPAVQPGPQVVGQGLGRRVAAAGVLLQASQADRLQVAGQRGVELARRLGGAVADRVDRLHHAVATEGARPVSRE